MLQICSKCLCSNQVMKLIVSLPLLCYLICQNLQRCILMVVTKLMSLLYIFIEAYSFHFQFIIKDFVLYLINFVLLIGFIFRASL